MEILTFLVAVVLDIALASFEWWSVITTMYFLPSSVLSKRHLFNGEKSSLPDGIHVTSFLSGLYRYFAYKRSIPLLYCRHSWPRGNSKSTVSWCCIFNTRRGVLQILNNDREKGYLVKMYPRCTAANSHLLTNFEVVRLWSQR